MSFSESVATVRKRLGIKNLRKKIPMSASEKATVLGLRKKGREVVTHRAGQSA